MKGLRANVEKFLAAHVESIRPHGSDELSIPCYSCDDDSDHLWVNKTTGLFICYHCGESGNAVKLVAKIAGVTYEQAAAMLRREVRQKIDDYDDIKALLTEEDSTVAAADDYKYARRLPPEYLPLPPIKMEGSAKRAYDYLRGRNITDERMQRYQLGYCLRGRFQGRIIAPVLSYSRPIYFVARDFTNRKRAKVLTPLNVEGRLRASDVVYNLDEAAQQEVGIITEGWADAVATMGAALLGKRISPVQLALIRTAGRGRWKHVVIMFDSDDPGAMKSANAAARALGSYYEVRLADLPSGEDPASADNPMQYADKAEEFDAVTRAAVKVRRELL